MPNSTLEIIPFKEEFTPYFYELNVAWLKKYFYVEPYDELILGNPQRYIIDKGGFIFFGRYQNEIVGVVSLINQGSFFELSKMAVTPQFQGLKIGLQLMEFTIKFAKSKGWDNLILYSNRKLAPAISLYSKLGFKEILLETDVNYERADIKMELSLS